MKSVSSFSRAPKSGLTQRHLRRTPPLRSWLRWNSTGTSNKSRTLLTGSSQTTPSETYSVTGIAKQNSWINDVLPFTPSELPRVEALHNQPPIVILPGFGNNSSDYTAPFGEEEFSLAASLQDRGFNVFVVPVERRDWFKVARALLSRRFWTKTCTTDPGYTWYLDRVAATIDEALEETGSTQVDLVGHSAGGWLARAFLVDGKYIGGGAEVNGSVRRLVTLGTPHQPPPNPSKDVTAGALSWIDAAAPEELLSRHGVKCACVCGRAVRGNSEAAKNTLGRYAFNSYSMVCGEGEGTEGDCVVPVRSAGIEGVETLVLDGVFHSMSKVGTYGVKAEPPWYGSGDVVDAWLGALVGEAGAEPVGPVGSEEADPAAAAAAA